MAYYRKRGNSWEYRIKYNESGQQKTLSKSGFSSKSAARAAAILVEEKLFKGGIDEVRKGEMLFEDWVQRYKKIHDSQRRESSNVSAENGQKKLLARFSGYKLKNINREEYQIFINELLFEHDYSKNTVDRIHGEMMSIINTAVEHERLEKNKLRSISIKKDEDNNKIIFLTLEESQKLLEVMETQEMFKKVMVHILLKTGIRSGELLGLMWKDISFENQTMTIDRQRTRDGLGPLKTDASYRTIVIDDELNDLLKEFQAWQEENKSNDDTYIESEYVMVDETGKLFYHTKPQDMMKNFLRYAKIPERKSTHLLRHTHAVLLLEAGVDIKTVSTRLGHKNINITANTYLHVTQNHEQKSIEKFINYLNF
ncbi:tyrosine-type recombinase/integrase [Lysinibacillus louembei]|uniref:Tyrosine-type recombinase/integrase n=1 Tax=Lysinibacillus louembei TaxID=1470088 RepID=A0ABZ0RZD2_9BACI|nr:tyrosine-type recombinase/integrase [Lysinibacillus louembei]WPK12293.1 tyrosine-type recombinase/integrase [Lysinibacillus louembei]